MAVLIASIVLSSYSVGCAENISLYGHKIGSTEIVSREELIKEGRKTKIVEKQMIERI